MFAHAFASPDSAKEQSLLDTSFLTVLLGAYIFSVGWSFVYIYYDALGISVAALSIPLQTYYMFALTVLLNTPVMTWLFLMALFTSAYIATILRPLKWLFAPLLIALLVVGYYNARDRAAQFVKSVRDGQLAPKIVLFLKKDAADNMSEELKQANKRGELRLLAHTSEHVFVLWLPPSEKHGYTFQILKEALHGHRVQIFDERLDATRR